MRDQRVSDQRAVERIEQLQRRVEELEQAYVQLSRAVRRARIYAGDNLPADKGLTMVAMLEKALAGESS